MVKKRLSVLRAMLLVLFTIQATAALADRDYEEARRLHDAGEILSLEQVLQKVRETHPGRVLEAELEREHGQLLYEIEILGNDGIVREVMVDARSGEVLKQRRDND